MRRSGLFFCFVSGLFSLLSCALKKMPEGELVRLELTHSGTMAGYRYEGRVMQDSTGTFVLRAMKENYGPLFEKKIDAEAMKQFRQIIEEEKMYKYKEAYRPKFEVLDGSSWSFKAVFSDGSDISSHGYNAGPKGNGLERIVAFMDELIQDGILIENPETIED